MSRQRSSWDWFFTKKKSGRSAQANRSKYPRSIQHGSDARGRQKCDYCSGKVYGPHLFPVLQNLATADSCGGVCTKTGRISNVLLLLFNVADGMPRYVSSMKLEVAWWTRVVRFSRAKISFENDSLNFCVSHILGRHSPAPMYEIYDRNSNLNEETTSCE